MHFKKHNPMWAYLEQQKVRDGVTATKSYSSRKLHSGENATESPTKFDVKIEDMFIEAEVMTLDTACPSTGRTCRASRRTR